MKSTAKQINKVLNDLQTVHYAKYCSYKNEIISRCNELNAMTSLTAIDSSLLVIEMAFNDMEKSYANYERALLLEIANIGNNFEDEK